MTELKFFIVNFEKGNDNVPLIFLPNDKQNNI